MRREALVPLQALAVCAIGGAACQFLKAPLPWMIGPLAAMAILKFSGSRLTAPKGGRELGQLLIGCTLGARFEQVFVKKSAALHARSGPFRPARHRAGRSIRLARGLMQRA